MKGDFDCLRIIYKACVRVMAVLWFLFGMPKKMTLIPYENG